MKRLRLYLEQIENTIAMRVLEQENIDSNLSSTVRIEDYPCIYYHAIYLRGNDSVRNNITTCTFFETNEDAKEHLKNVVSWLDEVFCPKEGKGFVVGQIVEVSNDGEYWSQKRIFLHDLGARFKRRFIVVDKSCEGEYINGNGELIVSGYSYCRLVHTGYDEYKKEYYGELEE